MGWTGQGGTAVTWTGGTTSTMTWGSSARSNGHWELLSPQPPTSDNGVNFELRFRTESPMYFSEDRPLRFVSSLSGEPL